MCCLFVVVCVGACSLIIVWMLLLLFWLLVVRYLLFVVCCALFVDWCLLLVLCLSVAYSVC